MNYKDISKLIMLKTSRFVRISLCIFLLSMIMLSSVLILLCNQYIEAETQLIDNDNVHLIRVEYQQSDDNQIQQLDFSDKKNISNYLQEEVKSAQCELYTRYYINFGIEDSEDNVYQLAALDDDICSVLDIFQIENNCIYDSEISKSSIELLIPVINCENGGWSSEETKTLTVTCKSSLVDDSLNLYSGENHNSYISLSTYKKIIESMFSMSWEEFVDAYDEDNPFGIDTIDAIYIYVDDVKDVESVAKCLNSHQYITNYTFEAFDNISATMRNVYIVAIVLILLVVLISCINVIMTIRSYLKVQQKDMGILRHYGYLKKEVYIIYTYNVNRIFKGLLIIESLYTIIFSCIFIRQQYLLISLSGILFVIMILMFVLDRIIIKCLVKKYTQYEVLDLLKYNKEFE